MYTADAEVQTQVFPFYYFTILHYIERERLGKRKDKWLTGITL